MTHYCTTPQSITIFNIAINLSKLSRHRNIIYCLSLLQKHLKKPLLSTGDIIAQQFVEQRGLKSQFLQNFKTWRIWFMYSWTIHDYLVSKILSNLKYSQTSIIAHPLGPYA
ncbi:unnamed protein product [Rhizophagus irregularis]|nr:unnamed protein product [Rhizophagus irregularis]